jgi:diguanylate cyclase (GGDEF)-like protein
MLKNVTNVKKTSVSGLYLEKDAAMQDRPLIVIDPADSSLAPVLQRDIEQIYNLICEENIREPFVLIENFKPNSHYLQSDRVCNAIAFPSYDGDRFYGVMVCVATSYDFFLSGLSFYESAVMDFTSALISDRLYSQTEDMAKKDGLTKIFNRVYYNRFFPELCDQVMAGNSVMSLAMLDIDHFKSVNDTYGHLAGDEVIKMVAKVDEKYAEKYGGYAVRFGGEEFLLILPGVGLSDAKDILQQLHRDVRETVIHFEDKDISVNLSIGIACYKETCGNLQEIVDRADRAMYYSKEHGRGRITIDGKEGE